MEFSKKLKTLRLQANFTQNELADKLFISRQAVSNYEQGRGYPSIDILVEMSKLFNTDLDELLSTGMRNKHFKNFMILISLMFLGSIVNMISLYCVRGDADI